MKPIVLPPTNRTSTIGGLSKLLETIHTGKPVRVKVEIARPDKTSKQNRYLWAVPYKMLSDATGYEADALHEWMCAALWGWETKPCPKSPTNPNGLVWVPARTTTTGFDGTPELCSQEDMVKLWEIAQRRGAALGIVIPDPDKTWWKQ
jgi:hypothetical protein